MFLLAYVYDCFFEETTPPRTISYDVVAIFSTPPPPTTTATTYDSTAFGIGHVPVYFANYNRQTAKTRKIF